MKNTLKELVIFGIIGLALLGADFCLYAGLFYLGASLEISKGASYLIGTLCSFYLNQRFTFKQRFKARFLARFLILYGFSFLVNVGANSAVFYGLGDFFVAYFVALILAVGINFLGQKFWVFKERK